VPLQYVELKKMARRYGVSDGVKERILPLKRTEKYKEFSIFCWGGN
jgi:hypothetical protein